MAIYSDCPKKKKRKREEERGRDISIHPLAYPKNPKP
jgi:hypothetical protein